MKRLEQRIRTEGLLAPDDVLIAAEVGDVVMWRSNGRLRPHDRSVMAIGYGNRGLAIVGQEWVTGVDLLMVRRVEVLDEGTSRPTIRIGSRRLLFSGTGQALFDGQLEQAADSFLDKSGLMELRLDSNVGAWRPKPEADSQPDLDRDGTVTGPTAPERRPSRSGRTAPKRR
jgi:hypothetical protein